MKSVLWILKQYLHLKSLGLYRFEIRNNLEQTDTKSIQRSYKDFVIDHGLVKVVIQTRLLQELVSVFS